MSAALVAHNGLIPCADPSAWNFLKVRAAALRLWLPISLSVVVHLIALVLLHNLLLHGKSGQLDLGADPGLQVRLIAASSDSRSARDENAATPLSNAALPGHAPDLAQLATSRDAQLLAAEEKPVTPAAPAHPQKQVDGAAALSASSATTNGVAVRPQAASSAKGNFDSSYVPSTLVERAPIPLTQPDLGRLGDMPRPRAAIHLRAYVEQSGTVHDVVVISCDPEDQATADMLASIYKSVVYIAAYDHGRQVPSKIDFTIAFSDASQPSDRPDPHIIRRSQQ